jgi:hypothetical protein
MERKDEVMEDAAEVVPQEGAVVASKDTKVDLHLRNRMRIDTRKSARGCLLNILSGFEKVIV